MLYLNFVGYIVHRLPVYRSCVCSVEPLTNLRNLYSNFTRKFHESGTFSCPHLHLGTFSLHMLKIDDCSCTKYYIISCSLSFKWYFQFLSYSVAFLDWLRKFEGGNIEAQKPCNNRGPAITEAAITEVIL